jgi:drug/metabolite transporter (DMT)-like permease
MSRFKVLAAFILLSITWGSSYLFIRVGIEHVTPLALVALRLLIGAITLGIIALVWQQNMRVSRAQLLALFVVGVINTTIPFSLITWGEESVPSGLTSVFNSTVPIFGVILAAIVLRDEPLTRLKTAGIGVGFLGVLLLASRDLGHGFKWQSIGGQAAIVLAALCYATSAVFVRRTLRGVPALTIAVYAVAFAAAQSMVLSLIFSPPSLESMQFSTVFAFFWLGILGSGLAYIFYYFVLENWGASRTTLVTYVIPVTGLTLGAIFLHETIDSKIIAGSLLVISGVVLASLSQVAQPQSESESQHIEPQDSTPEFAASPATEERRSELGTGQYAECAE